MILNRLVVVNFGVYRGRHEFQLRPQQTAPIILFGGNNGSGKTTLLNAMRLCLHGRRSLDEWAMRAASDTDYERYLRSRIHHSPHEVLSLDWASVELEFEFAVAGERHTYTIERCWQDKGKRVDETLNVFQGAQRLGDVDAEQWDDLIRDFVPPTVAHLFFFDAERVQSLINGSSEAHNTALSQAVKSLLGLNTIEQLQQDLRIYRRRQQQGNGRDEVDRKIDMLDEQIAALNAEEQGLLAARSSIGREMEAIEANIELQEAEIARAGGGFAYRRESYKEARIRLQAQIEEVKQMVRKLCAGLLPFAISPTYTAAVKEQLLREAEYQRWLASKAFIEERLRDIRAEVASPEFWAGTGAEALHDFQHTIGNRVVQTLQAMVEPPAALRDVALRHQASEPEQREMLQWIDESQTATPKELQSLTDRLAKLTEEREEAESALQRVPADDVLGPLVEKLNTQTRALTTLTQEQLKSEDRLHHLALRRDELQRSLHKAWEAKEARDRLSQKVRRVVDVELVLDDFRMELLRARVSQIQDSFVRNFNQLCRKERLLQRAEVDLDDFAVLLVGAGGKQFPHSELSAGEQQIYAIALFWALRQVSGRPLPLVLDAPLGRLDSEHRQHLVGRYFPHASQQVILFSTDTEVDEGFYSDIQSQVSRAYHLDYDQQRNATEVREGYFWQHQGSRAEWT